MVKRFFEEAIMTARKQTRLLREGDYIAEVDVELLEEEGGAGWGSYLCPEDALKLGDVRIVLRDGDIARAAKLARVYRLTLVPAA
jgi:hypothetical protein